MIKTLKIVFPVLMGCLIFCSDDFWKDIFKDLIHGIVPHDINISGIKLYQKRKSCLIDETLSSEDLYKQIYSFLSKNSIVCIKHESLKKTIDVNSNELTDELMFDSWANIKKKSTKEFFIHKFVIKNKNKYDLSDKQAALLNNTINLAINFKTLDVKDIIVKDNEIYSINKIHIGDKELVIDEKIYDIDASSSGASSTNTKQMTDVWLKYLKDTQKYF